MKNIKNRLGSCFGRLQLRHVFWSSSITSRVWSFCLSIYIFPSGDGLEKVNNFGG